MRSSSARAHHPSDDLPAIHVPADPNGLAVRDDTLYVADGATGAVLAIDHGRTRRIATIDAAGVVAGDRLGGIAVTPDGTLYVARLGHGHAGAVLRIAGGVVRELARLSPQAWRLGVSYDAAEHALYVTQYLKAASGPCDGSILRIELATGAVRTVVGGLVKPVGVAKLGSTLVISDARLRAVLRAELAGGPTAACVPLVSTPDRPDAVAACGGDSIVLTSYDPDTQIGRVQQLWLDGRVRTLAQGAWQPRGVASDGARAFVSVRSGGRVLVIPL